MSVPIASGTCEAATRHGRAARRAARDARARSQGLAVGPNAECSVEEPIANSSMFVLPTTTAPAASRRSAMCASYGAMKPSRMRLPAVAGRPAWRTRSLRATGMPSRAGRAATASGPSARARTSRASAALAASRARSASIRESRRGGRGPVSSMRARWASSSSTAPRSPVRRRAAMSMGMQARQRRVDRHATVRLARPGRPRRGSPAPRCGPRTAPARSRGRPRPAGSGAPCRPAGCSRAR